MPLKIRTKLMGAFLVMLIPLAVLIGINRYNQRVIHLATHKVEDIHKEISSLSDLQIALNMLIMPPNDYLITGDISERVEFNHIITEIEGHLLNISTTMRCNKCHEITDEMVKKLYRVESKSFWSEEMASVKGIMDGLQIVKEKGEKIFKIEKPLGSTEGAMLMKEMDAMARNLIREDILKHKKKDEKELISAIKDSERVWRMSWFMMIGGFALSVSMGLFFAFFYSGFFVRPIEKLHHGADAIAGGDFKSRVDIKTGDEIEQLSNAMNEMAAQLDSLYSNLNEMVEEKTKGLKESEEKYRTMIENSNDWMWTLTPDGRLNFINKQAEEASGYSHEEWLGKTFEPLVLEDDLPMVADIHNKIVKGEKAHYEVRVKRKDGGVIILSVNASPISKDGKVTGTISFGMDITEQKQAEAAFRTLVGTAVTNVGAEFFHETVSSLCIWLGVECVIIGELVDENKVQALAMQVDGKAVEHYEYALAGTPCESATQKGYCEYHEGVVQLFPADKDLVDIRAEAYVGIPTRDKNGKVNGILCAISRHKFVPPPMAKEVFEIIAARAGVEIERKKAEELLRETRDYLENLLDYANAPIIVWGQSYRITKFNHAFERMTGRDASEVIGKEIDVLFPADRKDEALSHIRQTKTGERWETVEIPILHTNGAVRTALWNSATLYSADGKSVVATIAQGQDITERKKAEEKIKEQLDYLERFQKVAVKREFRIKDLRDENDRLKVRIEEMEKKFKS